MSYEAHEVSSEGWVVSLAEAIVKTDPRMPGGVRACSGRVRGTVGLFHPDFGVFAYANPYMDGEDQGVSILLCTDSPWGVEGESWEYPSLWTGGAHSDVETWTHLVTIDLCDLYSGSGLIHDS